MIALTGQCVPGNPKHSLTSAFFREIDRADELGSGMRKMMLYGKKYGGADPQLIEGDNFRMIISVPEFSGTGEEETAQVGEQVGEQVGVQVGTKSGPSRDQVEVMRKCISPSAIGALMAVLGRTNRTKFRDQVLNPILKAELIEMTIPDKPRSSKQKYRLTDKGRAMLKELES